MLFRYCSKLPFKVKGGISRSSKHTIFFAPEKKTCGKSVVVKEPLLRYYAAPHTPQNISGRSIRTWRVDRGSKIRLFSAVKWGKYANNRQDTLFSLTKTSKMASLWLIYMLLSDGIKSPQRVLDTYSSVMGPWGNMCRRGEWDMAEEVVELAKF